MSSTARSTGNQPSTTLSGLATIHGWPRWLANRWRIVTALAAVALLSSACSATSGPGDQPSQASNAIFTIGVDQNPPTFDPVQGSTATGNNIMNYGVETLIKFSRTGALLPDLATSWSFSKSGTALTFKLRTGVKFQDGTPFNAQAVKFSLERIFDPAIHVGVEADYADIAKITVVNPSTILFTLKAPEPELLGAFTAVPAGIISPTSVNKYGNSYTNIVHPVGTGPYEFESFTSGSQVVYKRFNGFWGPKPYYSKLIFDIIPDDASREAALRAGQVNLIKGFPITDIASLRASGYTVLAAPSNTTVFLTLNTSRPPFNNVDVRRAFNYAVNKAAIIKDVLRGTGTVMDSPFATSLAGYCPVGSYGYDPAKAKQLLAQSRLGKLTVTLGVAPGFFLQDVQASEAIAGYLSNVGVTVQIKQMDFASLLSEAEAKNGPLDMTMFGIGAATNNALGQMVMLTKATMPPDGVNVAFYTDPKVESLYSEAKVNPDTSARDAEYCQIQKTVWSDAPWVFLWQQPLLLAYDSNLTGISYQPNAHWVATYVHPK